MMKTFLFAAALASLALAGGCATGGNGTIPPPVTIDVTLTSPSNTNASALYPTEPVTLTATVSNSSTTAVTWSLSGTNCTGSACGTLTPTTPAPTPATANYVAPATPTAGVTVTATLAADSTKTGTLSITVIDVTTDVAPATLSVGQGLTQTFTAVAVPDDAGTQNFTWTCHGGRSCHAARTTLFRIRMCPAWPTTQRTTTATPKAVFRYRRLRCSPVRQPARARAPGTAPSPPPRWSHRA